MDEHKRPHLPVAGSCRADVQRQPSPVSVGRERRAYVQPDKMGMARSNCTGSKDTDSFVVVVYLDRAHRRVVRHVLHLY